MLFKLVLPNSPIYNVGFQANLTGLKNTQTLSQNIPYFSNSQALLVLVVHNIIIKIFRFMFPQAEMLSSLSAAMTITRRMVRRIETLFHAGRRERFPRSSAKRT